MQVYRSILDRLGCIQLVARDVVLPTGKSFNLMLCLHGSYDHMSSSVCAWISATASVSELDINVV